MLIRNNCIDWSLFWSAASAIGTIFVGLVAVGITIWQTHLQYRSKVLVNTCLSTLAAIMNDGSEKVESVITITITNVGNSPMVITHFCLCYKDTTTKKERLMLNNPLSQSAFQKALPNPQTPYRLNGKDQVAFYYWDIDALIESKGSDFDLRVRVINSLNKRFYIKQFSVNSLRKEMATLDIN